MGRGDGGEQLSILSFVMLGEGDAEAVAHQEQIASRHRIGSVCIPDNREGGTQPRVHGSQLGTPRHQAVRLSLHTHGTILPGRGRAADAQHGP